MDAVRERVESVLRLPPPSDPAPDGVDLIKTIQAFGSMAFGSMAWCLVVWRFHSQPRNVLSCPREHSTPRVAPYDAVGSLHVWTGAAHELLGAI